MLGVNCRRPDDDFECKCATLADGALCDICGDDDESAVAEPAEPGATEPAAAAAAAEPAEPTSTAAATEPDFVPRGGSVDRANYADFVLVGESAFTPMRNDVVEWLAELGLELLGFGNDDEGCTIINVRGSPERMNELFRGGIVGALAHPAVPGLVQGFRPGIKVHGVGIVYPMDPATY